MGSRGFLGFFRDFRDLAEFSGIWDWDWDLIFQIWDLGLGFGIGFENLGSGIGIWDTFTKNPGFGIPGSQIADPWARVNYGE